MRMALVILAMSATAAAAAPPEGFPWGIEGEWIAGSVSSSYRARWLDDEGAYLFTPPGYTGSGRLYPTEDPTWGVDADGVVTDWSEGIVGQPLAVTGGIFVPLDLDDGSWNVAGVIGKHLAEGFQLGFLLDFAMQLIVWPVAGTLRSLWYAFR